MLQPRANTAEALVSALTGHSVEKTCNFASVLEVSFSCVRKPCNTLCFLPLAVIQKLRKLPWGVLPEERCLQSS